MKRQWIKIGKRLIVYGVASAVMLSLWGCAADNSTDAASGQETSGQTGQGADANPVEEYIAKTNIDQNQVDKAETVYIKADAEGSVNEVRVDTVLKNHGGLEDIEDVSNLENIRNMEGDEEFTQEGSRITWENHGADITYRGNSTDELPIGVKISYQLDGKDIAPQALIGQSGHVVIHFDYENHTREKITIDDKEYEVPIPFIFLSMVTLDKEKFTNVEISSGTVTSQSGSTFAVGYALPGIQDALGLGDYEMTEDMDIPESVEIEADVTDFELEFTETIVTNGFFADIEDEDLSDLRESGDSMDELSDASGKLVSGTQTLYDSMVKYQGYLNQYLDGASQIQSGVDGLEGGLQTLSDQGSQLSTGAQGLSDGMAAYASGYHDVMQMVQAYGDAIPPELAGALEQLGTNADALAESSSQVAAGVSAYTGGVTQVYEGSKQLSDGVDTFVSTGSQLKDGMSGLVTGTNKLLSGIRTFDKEGIQELTETFGTDLQEILDKVEALKQADQNYTNYAGIVDDRTGSVMFMFETEELTK